MSNKMIFPAGKYWIGDPCYVFPNDGPFRNRWDELLDEVEYFETLSYGELDDGKIKVWAAHTAYGDGRFVGSNGAMFPVDAGLIGIVPMDTVEYLNRTDNDLDYCGQFVEFKESFVVESRNGDFIFGHIGIDTGDDGDDGQYDDDYDYNSDCDGHRDDYDFDGEWDG